MKAGRKFTITCLILALAIASFVPSTFSWYDHNGEQNGDKMAYVRNDLPVSTALDANITMQTKMYRMDGKRIYYDKKGNKEYKTYEHNNETVQIPAITAVDTKKSVSDVRVNYYTVPSDNVQYYGTTFTNTNTGSDVFVNLYLKDFTHNPNNHIGTIAPSLTYKGLSSSAHLANKNMIRAYFQCDVKNWKDAGATLYVVYKTKGAAAFAYQTINKTTNITTSNVGTTGKKAYYSDLPDNTTEFYFATDGAVTGGFDTTTLKVKQSWFRTNSVTNIQPEVCYSLTGSTDDTTWNAEFETIDVPGGISVKTCYDKVTMNMGQSAYIELIDGTNYTGESISYGLYSGNNFTVDANTGEIVTSQGFTGIDNQGNSNAKASTTITGSLGDTYTLLTDISNPGTLPYVTIATNVRVPAATEEEIDGETVVVPGKSEIIWYIDNLSNANCTYEAVYYTE